MDRSDVEFLQGMLKNELQFSGFQIAEKPAAANAVLSSKSCGSAYVGKGQRIEGQFREAAAVCARKLAHARKKSAHDAGLKAARP
ncbi:MAG TPA: hypothetical protein VN893_01925 [Bryobacteraceae bacterium]|nr:hypothetical protein [Bryobacteraceae bacterium]